MATDLENKQGNTTNPDPGQSFYDREFNALTRHDHLARDGRDPSENSPTDSSAQGNKSGVNSKDDTKDNSSFLDGRQLADREASSFFSPTDSGASGSIKSLKTVLAFGKNRKRALVGGGLVSSIVAAAFFGFTILSGPLQIIHFGQLIQGARLSSSENESDFRLTRAWRFLYHARAGQLQNDRMSYFGNKYADRIEAKFNATGLKSQYGTKFALFDGLEIDRKAPSYRNKSDPQITEEFKAKFGAEVKVGSNGRLLVSPVDNGRIFGFRSYFQQKSMLRTVLVDSGYSKVGSWYESRVMAKRYGLSLHPLKRLDTRVLRTADARYAAWKETRDAQLKGNTSPVITTEEKVKADDPNTPANEATGTTQDAGEVKTATQDFIEGSKTPGAASDLQAKFSNPKVVGAAAIAGVACLVSGLNEGYEANKQDQVVLPLMRVGVRVASLTGQAMTGSDDPTLLEQFGNESQMLFNSKDKTSFSSAPGILTLQGEAVDSNEKEDPIVKSLLKESPFAFISAFKSLLDPVCSPVGIAVQIAIGFIGGPFTAAAGLVIGEVLGPPIIKAAINFVSGKAVNLDDPSVPGKTYGTYADVGLLLYNNANSAAKSGTVLSDQEVGEIAALQSKSQQAEFMNKPMVARVFDRYDRRSAVSAVIDSSSPNLSQNVGLVFNKVINVRSILANFGRILSPRSYAANTPYNYGIPIYGTSVAELENPSVQDPFVNADIVAGLLDKASTGPDLIERAKLCKNVILSKSPVEAGGKDLWDATLNEGTLNLYSKDYMSAAAKAKCDDKSDTNWLRVREFIANLSVIKATACYEGDELACADTGNGATSGSTQTTASAPGIIGDIGLSSDSIDCPANTKTLGVTTSQYSGSLKKESGTIQIRLCQLSSIGGSGNDSSGNRVSGGAVVNSRVAGTFQAMGEAAKAANVSISATSSFRLNDSCAGTGDGSLCATANGSMHQLGVAIDFSGPTVKNAEAKTCANRVRDPSDATWNWLNKNAAAFGIKQYSVESWHWDASGLPNRCGGDGS